MSDAATAGAHLLADRYRIGEQLGRGGMAEVHEGYDTRLGRKVAVKLLRPALANDPAFRTRFRQEAQAAARMTHPTIVRVYDAGEQTVQDANGDEIQLPFIVMEHVDGTLLRDLVAKGPVPAPEAVRIVDGILTALEYSHRAGVVHRDIKPGNVMVLPSGQVKVMDFGIARAISDSSATIAQTSAILGTAQYFSPEQAKGEPLDARTDLYSTGVVLYELLTGKPPFQSDSAVAVAYQHLSETPATPSSVEPGIPSELDAVVLRSLAKDRDLRFQTAEEFRQALDAAMGGEAAAPEAPSDAFTATLFGVAPGATSPSDATLRRLTQGSDDRAPRTQSRPPVAWIWGGIALMLVIVSAALYWVFTQTPTNLVGPDTVVTVPDVVGQDYETGGNTLLGANLTVDRREQQSTEVPAGAIISTDPPAGTRVEPGLLVIVYVSTGAPQTTLPSLTYKGVDEAVGIITGLGLQPGAQTAQYSPNVPAGVVIGAVPAGSSEAVTGSVQVPAGSTVDLYVSNGLVNVESVVGQPVAAARDLLSGPTYQLSVDLVLDSTCGGQTVKSQSIVGEQPQRSSVTLVYCGGS